MGGWRGITRGISTQLVSEKGLSLFTLGVAAAAAAVAAATATAGNFCPFLPSRILGQKEARSDRRLDVDHAICFFPRSPLLHDRTL